MLVTVMVLLQLVEGVVPRILKKSIFHSFILIDGYLNFLIFFFFQMLI